MASLYDPRDSLAQAVFAQSRGLAPQAPQPERDPRAIDPMDPRLLAQYRAWLASQQPGYERDAREGFAGPIGGGRVDLSALGGGGPVDAGPMGSSPGLGAIEPTGTGTTGGGWSDFTRGLGDALTSPEARSGALKGLGYGGVPGAAAGYLGGAGYSAIKQAMRPTAFPGYRMPKVTASGVTDPEPNYGGYDPNNPGGVLGGAAGGLSPTERDERAQAARDAKDAAEAADRDRDFGGGLGGENY